MLKYGSLVTRGTAGGRCASSAIAHGSRHIAKRRITACRPERMAMMVSPMERRSRPPRLEPARHSLSPVEIPSHHKRFSSLLAKNSWSGLPSWFLACHHNIPFASDQGRIVHQSGRGKMSRSQFTRNGGPPSGPRARRGARAGIPTLRRRRPGSTPRPQTSQGRAVQARTTCCGSVQ